MCDIHAYLVTLVPNENFLIGISVNSGHFTHGAAGLSFRPIKTFFYEDLWDLIIGLTQSNDDFCIDDTFILHATYVEVPVGSGARRRIKLTIDSVSRKSVVAIKNDDNLCLPRALVVGEAHIIIKSCASVEARKEWRAVCDGRRKLQQDRAEKLVRDSNVRIPAVGCGFYEIERFQEYYKQRGIAIVVYDKVTFGSGEPAFFDGRTQIENPQAVINLIYDPSAKHYDTVLNLIGLARTKFYCPHCNKCFAFVEQHRCRKTCARCFVSPACQTDVPLVNCTVCNRQFFGAVCFENHNRSGTYKKNNKKLCDIVKMCRACRKLINTRREKNHVCGNNWCSRCKTKHSPNNYCYIQPIKINANNHSRKKVLFIFYDFETRQDVLYKDKKCVNLHIPNLCIAQQACSDCIDIDDVTQVCATCGIREYIFIENPVKQLIELCVRERTIFQNIICIAHNAQGYDAQFILKELSERACEVAPSVVLNGQNILTLEYGRAKFIDSLNYFHMKLSALPATFDLPASNKKGYFPHLFNRLENSDYIGPLPDARFYSPDSMSVNERSAFFTWYNENAKTYVFDFKKDIIDYCRMDVEILRRACVAFRKIFLAVGDTDPFVSATTIASACSHVYRKKFLKPDTIGIIPANGYRRADKHSQKAVEWLLNCERELNREIIHAGRQREYRLPEGQLVDGYLPDDQGKGIVFEFQGCYVHGCPTCFDSNREKKNIHGRTYNEAFESTRAKIAQMKENGYEIREIWECEFDRCKSNDPSIERYLKNHPLIEKLRLNPREAFYGGRTENIRCYYKIREGETIKYTDICSLYPYVCKRGRFPVGHPRIYVGAQCEELTGGRNDDLSRVEGLVKCKILPPRDLFLPLLPVKMHGRLLFALCRSCCEETRQGPCTHENICEREFTGTWVADELRKAVQLGYRVTEIFIIWQYTMTQYDPITATGGLFAEYVNTFLRIKQQASGWPAGCTSESEKERYIREYQEAEGIRLDPEKIEKNAGLRAVAKLCLNSFWGKFGQRNNLKQTVVIKNREELLKILTDPEKEVTSILLVSDNVVYICWRFIEDAVESAAHTSVAIAAYTTAQARLKLYTYLENLGRRVLYYDTDSCIFLCSENDPDEYRPHIGSLLGDMTDELKSYGEAAHIDTFVSGGPKFYGYKVINPADGTTVECCKIKGITLNYLNSLKINFDSINDLICRAFAPKKERDQENVDDNIKLNFRSIRRLPTHDIVTRDEVKTCSIVLRKRRYISLDLSLPFGYK